MSRTLSPYTGSGSGGALQAGDKWGFQKAEATRQALDIAMYLGLQADFGGDERPILSASYVPVNGARGFSLEDRKSVV